MFEINVALKGAGSLTFFPFPIETQSKQRRTLRWKLGKDLSGVTDVDIFTSIRPGEIKPS